MSDYPEKTETEYQLGMPAGNDGEKMPKQGKKCCGGCCDMRRAVIIVNIINAGMLFLGLMSVLAARNLANNVNNGEAQAYDDDEVTSAFEEFENLPVGYFVCIQTIKLLACVVGIIGALQYNIWMVGAAAAAYVVDFAVGLISLNVLALVYPAFFAYPHFYFIDEVKKGTMTKENYHNEQHSCCCV